MQSVWSPQLGALGCPLIGLCGSSCYNWVLMTIVPFVCWTDPQVVRVLHTSLTMVCKLMCRCWPHKVGFASAVCCACQNFPLDMLLLKIIESCSDLSEQCVGSVNCELSVLVLDLLGGTLVQANIRCCLWVALSNLFGAMSNPVCHCLSWAWDTWGRPSCTPRPAFTSTKPRGKSAKSQRHPRFTFTCLCLMSAW